MRSGLFKFVSFLVLSSILLKVSYSTLMSISISVYQTIPNLLIADLLTNMLIAFPIYLIAIGLNVVK